MLFAEDDRLQKLSTTCVYIIMKNVAGRHGIWKQLSKPPTKMFSSFGICLMKDAITTFAPIGSSVK